MGLPRKDYTGQEAELTVTEFRSAPGDAIDRAAHGMIIHITVRGKRVAILGPAETVIHKDGTYSGARPLMLGVRP